jgi:hypothetical protein
MNEFVIRIYEAQTVVSGGVSDVPSRSAPIAR